MRAQGPVLSVFFIAAILSLNACNPKPVHAQNTAADSPDAVSTATPTADAETGSATPPAIAAATGAKESAALAELAKLGFHVFPEPVQLPPFLVPSLTVTAASGNAAPPALDSSKLSGKITLLNFWATWCPPCKAELPSIERLNNLMNGYNFRIAAVSVGEKPETVQQFIRENKYTFPVYLDQNGQLGAAFASQGIPTTYILDKTGKIIAGIVGSREYDEPALVSILKDLAGQ